MEPNNDFAGAARDGDIETVARLLDAGVHPDTPNSAGSTALERAACSNHTSIATLLLECGARPDPIRERPHSTALIYAATKGNDELVSRLLEAGANPNIRDESNGQTALIWASAYGRSPKVVEILLRHGADRTIVDVNGNTALTIAEHFDFAEIVNLLKSQK